MNREKTDFIWNGQNLAYESKSGAINTYIYDMTGIHIANKDGTVTSYLKDYHGNIVGYADISGRMIQDAYERMDYDAFGNQRNGSLPEPFGYCGEYYDSESGLIYLRNRYYDSADGRFITEDPIKDGRNWYAYCAGNPVMFVDPFGLKNVIVKYIMEKNGGSISYDEYNKQAVATLNEKTVRYDLTEDNVFNGRLVLDDTVLRNDFKLNEKQTKHEPGDKFDCTEDVALAWSLTYYDESNEKKQEYTSLIVWGMDGNREYVTFGYISKGTKYSSTVDRNSKPLGTHNATTIHSHPDVLNEDIGADSYNVSSDDINMASNTDYGYYGFIYVVTPKEILKYSQDGTIKSIKYK